MGQVVQFPQRKPARLFGVFSENEMIAAQHLVLQRKAKYVSVTDLPDSLRKSKFGEWARRGVLVEGRAVTEFENLCVYLLDLHA